MNIDTIYSKINILPSLGMHQKRVAAVAWQICDSLTSKIDSESVVRACLLHDMGNIIKFDLTLYPEVLEPQGLEYWQKIKNEFMQKYGDDEHTATFKIIDEIGVDSRVEEIVKAIGFSKGPENLQHNDFGKKIACYSDHRVSPFGVLSLEERIADGYKRFKRNKPGELNEHDKNKLEKFESLKEAMLELEKQIFKESSMEPDDISDSSIEEYINKINSLNFDYGSRA